MAETQDRVLQEALGLPTGERARLVTELLASLAPDLPDRERTDDEWIAEIERRARAAIAGSPGISWAEARARIQERLSRR